MSHAPRISETEWEVMRVVWAKSPITAAEIIAALTAQDPTWHPKTIRTLLARLVRKKALRYRALGRAYAYAPRASQADCVAAVSASFVERVFGGALRPMLAHFVEARRPAPEELAALRALLEPPPPPAAPAAKKPRP
jgi:BlaI family penicillinase repressor